MAGAVPRAPGLALAWQGQRLGAVERAGVLSRAAVGSNLAWQAQHFGQASAEIVAGAVLRAPGLAFVCQGQRLGAV